MPAAVVKALAKKAGKTPEEVERLWNEVREDVEKEYPDVGKESPKFYAIIVSILKKRLKL